MVSGVDEQTHNRHTEEGKEDEEQTKVHSTPNPKYLQCLSQGSISVELIGHARSILRSIAKKGKAEMGKSQMLECTKGTI